MRTFAAAQKDRLESRYTSDDMPDLEGNTVAEARTILSSRGGKKAARLALRDLYQAWQRHPEGWLPTAQIRAPLRVLNSMTLAGLIEKGEGSRDINDFRSADQHLEGQHHTWRYRLSQMGRDIAQEAVAR